MSSLSKLKSDNMNVGVMNIMAMTVVAVALLSAPLLLSPYWLSLLISTSMFMSLAIGLHIVVGKCQLLDLGFAGFIALGAYTTAILMKTAHWGYWESALAATCVAFGAGVVFGLPALRLRGDYFAIVSFGFSELVVLCIRNWPKLTGGTLGIGDIPDPILFGYTFIRYPPDSYWFLSLAILGVVFSVAMYLSGTALGIQMVAVGDDPVLARSIGIDDASIKVAAIALSAAIGGLVGSFWAVYFKFLSAGEFSLNLSVQVLAIVILAGSVRLRDVVFAAAVLAPLCEVTRQGMRIMGIPDSARFMLYGIILVLIVVTRAQKNYDVKPQTDRPGLSH